MNTIPMAALLESPGNRATLGLRFPPAPPRPVPQWLPAPRPQAVCPRATGRPSKRLLVPPSRTPLSEKCLFACLVAAAGVGISYGFLCLIDLVQNWASFNAAIARMTS